MKLKNKDNMMKRKVKEKKRKRNIKIKKVIFLKLKKQAKKLKK